MIILVMSRAMSCSVDEERERVRSESHSRLNAVTSELRRLVSASKLHVVPLRNQQSDQTQLDELHRELASMNYMKVLSYSNSFTLYRHDIILHWLDVTDLTTLTLRHPLLPHGLQL